MQTLFTKDFALATAERMVRAAAASILGAKIGADLVFDVLQVNTWQDIASLGISGALVSLLLSLAGGSLGAGDGPSFGTEEVRKVG